MRLYRVCLGAAGLLVALLVALMLLAKPPQFGRAIIIDGNTMLLVRNEKAAAAVRERLLREGRGTLAGAATFRQKWEDAPRPADGAQVSSVAEAVRELRPRLTVICEAVAIETEGTRLVVVPDREVAQRVLDALKSRYASPPDALVHSTSLRPEPVIRSCMALPEEVVSDEAVAASRLTSSRVRDEACTVRAGDFPERIAARHHMSLADLWRLNPGLRGRDLHAGQTVRVLGPPAGLTVVTVKEIVTSQPVPAPVQRESSESVPRGEKRVAEAGAPGAKHVRWLVTMNDEREVARRLISEEVFLQPRPQRLLIGTGP